MVSQISHFLSYLNLFNIANGLSLSGIKFHIGSVPNLTVRLGEDSNTWVFLRIYLLSLVKSKVKT